MPIMSIFSGLPSRPNKLVPGSTSTSEFAAHTQRLLPDVHSGTLCFWGVWFGRPHDNRHSVVRAEAEGDCLVLHFNDEEILKVWHPQGWRIDAQQFVIHSATRVLWQWYWYGRPHAPANLMSHDFVRQGAEVSFQSTFPINTPGTPTLLEPAVQIH
jgi:hypothetical protein